MWIFLWTVKRGQYPFFSEIIIADEPTSSLDMDNRNRFLELLFAEAEQLGSALVFVSHDPYIANHFSRVIEMSEINRSKGEIA
jgi:putative ABC transport system ATP-binding protein